MHFLLRNQKGNQMKHFHSAARRQRKQCNAALVLLSSTINKQNAIFGSLSAKSFSFVFFFFSIILPSIHTWGMWRTFQVNLTVIPFDCQRNIFFGRREGAKSFSRLKCKEIIIKTKKNRKKRNHNFKKWRSHQLGWRTARKCRLPTFWVGSTTTTVPDSFGPPRLIIETNSDDLWRCKWRCCCCCWWCDIPPIGPWSGSRTRAVSLSRPTQDEDKWQ